MIIMSHIISTRKCILVILVERALLAYSKLESKINYDSVIQKKKNKKISNSFYTWSVWLMRFVFILLTSLGFFLGATTNPRIEMEIEIDKPKRKRIAFVTVINKTKWWK